MAIIKPLSAKKGMAKSLSPCVAVCQMDPLDRVCLGCYRTREEIASWCSMSEADQRALLGILSERRAAEKGAKWRRPRQQL